MAKEIKTIKMEEIEKILGRKPTSMEIGLWALFKDDEKYEFVKDKFGHLLAKLKE